MPEFTVTPSIVGVFAVGETLAGINTAATDAEGGEVVVTFKWLVGSLFLDETAVTYVIPADMVNASIKVEVTATDSEGGEVMVTTNTVNSGAFVAPTPDPDAVVDPVVDEANSAVKRSGGGGMGGLALLGLMLLSVWRVLVGRCSKRLVASMF